MEELPVHIPRYYPKINSQGLSRDFSQSPGTEIQEKLDGSQMSFAFINDNLVFFNRGREINQEAPDDVFHKAIGMLKCHLAKIAKTNPDLLKNRIFHGEVIGKLRHNKIVYERTPRFYFVLFDIYDEETASWLPHTKLAEIGQSLELEIIQLYWFGDVTSDENSLQKIAKDIVARMETGEFRSMLGGIPEGIVVKNPKFHNIAKNKDSATKIKHVRTQFKELHHLKSAPLVALPDANAIFDRIMACFPKEPRWAKSIQRLRDQSRLFPETEKNVPMLLRDIKRDLKEECSDIFMEYVRLELLPFFLEKFTVGFEEYYNACTQKDSIENSNF